MLLRGGFPYPPRRSANTACTSFAISDTSIVDASKLIGWRADVVLAVVAAVVGRDDDGGRQTFIVRRKRICGADADADEEEEEDDRSRLVGRDVQLRL